MFLSRLFWTGYQAYHMRGQAGYPFKPLTAIKLDQARRVRDMVAYAYRHVPYYRDTMNRLGLRPSDFRNAEDLSKLPLLERDQLQRDPEYFVSTAKPLDRYLLIRSGGSTGVPCKVYHDARGLFQHAAQRERERSIISALVGRGLGHRTTVIGLPPPYSSGYEAHRFCRDRGLFPSGVSARRQSLSLLDPPEKNIRLINEFKPDIIGGYGSYHSILFPYLKAKGAPFHRPKVVTYTSDALSGPVRNMIEKELNIPVFSSYQTVEAFGIAFECEYHQGMHLNIDLYPVRIVDAEGVTLQPGDSGEVVVSNLVNRATVLLNYRLGDVAAVLPGRCACGRSLPLLSFLHGRSEDWIELASGRLVHPQSLHMIMEDEEKIWQYQVIQETSRNFVIRVIAAEDCDLGRTREQIATEFVRALGDDVTIDVSFVDSIDRTEGGKFRPILSLRSRLRDGPAHYK
jgi:phenylacetate-CoA ligase